MRAVEPRERPRRPWDDDPSNSVSGSRPTFDLSTRGDREIGAAVKRMENRWQDAIRNHDVRLLSALLADDFVGTSSTGRVGSKSTLIAELRRDKNVYTSVEARNMSVRTSGDDTAIVTGITRETGITPDGQRFRTSRRFTDTWVKRQGRWRCIASQTTNL
ncbi:MAG: nuclear transport factor 2 family protein [Chthoniobacterales bacterium]